MSALAGTRVVEIANEQIAYAGKLLGDMGADVVLVEPGEGDPSRGYPPFAEDESASADQPESLYWWHYNTSKRGIALDLHGLDISAPLADLARARVPDAPIHINNTIK